jgi:hypothetical protein
VIQTFVPVALTERPDGLLNYTIHLGLLMTAWQAIDAAIAP